LEILSGDVLYTNREQRRNAVFLLEEWTA